jgi:N-acylneuraminate cytidylyltransferase|tara:strand:- start:419 stop:1132 length:714 start_codon:yes stop_codon:yes gene_type:complete
MNIVSFIFARGDSREIKRKNLLKFKKTTLLGNSILQSKKSRYIKRIFVSTDSNKIAREAKKNNAEVPFIRPKYLAKAGSPEIYAWRHAINFLNKKLNLYPDYIVSVPTTCPLRRISDIDSCIRKAIKNNLDIVFTITPSSRNPYFNMLEKRKGKLNIFSKTGLAWNWNLKNKKIYRRQDAPKCFDLTTACYVFKPQYIQRTLNLFSGKTGFVLIPRIRSIDIDNSLDYKIVNLLIKS